MPVIFRKDKNLLLNFVAFGCDTNAVCLKSASAAKDLFGLRLAAFKFIPSILRIKKKKKKTNAEVPLQSVVPKHNVHWSMGINIG